MEKKLSAAEIDITVSDILQRYATEEQRKAHVDIADLLIQWKQNGELIRACVFEISQVSGLSE